jgi:diacylglycerol kinase (ATP)
MKSMKSHGGLGRLRDAAFYSMAGLRAAFAHEAAFRQELAIGVPAVLLAGWVAADRWQALALVGVIVGVWIVELLNSGLEALADSVSGEHHPLLGRAKDLGSAAVMLSVAFASVVWGMALWQRFVP